MQFDITPTDAPPRQLRELYFHSLSLPQVHYVEQRVRLANWFLIGPAAAPVGYAAVHNGAVVEFFAREAALPRVSEALHAVAARAGAGSAVVKSYDELALVAASDPPARVSILGVNCTSWSDERFEPPAGFRPRPGAVHDLALITTIGPGFFEEPAEIVPSLEAGEILIYELDGVPVGCGVTSPVRDGGDAMDVGVGVLPTWRRRGIGEQIIRHLKLRCLRDLGLRPTCGCAAENLASRRTLEKAGFLTQHRLLEFAWRS